ncbi:MAG: UDP-N-acetylmuramoyl-L-alanyl-D-glutamate--2,6-diaminopimelate ligase [Rhodospirillales bacterium]
MKLSELMQRADDTLTGGEAGGAARAGIAGLTCDSRAVQPGWLFAALPGADADGRDFIPHAMERGCAAVLAPKGSGPNIAPGVPFIMCENPRRAFARMAGAFYPERPETIFAVTGTNGKTSVASFLRQIWTAEGRAAAALGTLGVETDSGFAGGGLTTPDPVRLHETLSALAAKGVDCAVLEASSHGLDQFRLDGLTFQAAAFTNLSRDHLDYHGDMKTYAQAKSRLFRDLLEKGGAAVINRDDPAGGVMAAAVRAKRADVITYGRLPDAGVRITGQTPAPGGQTLELQIFGDAHTCGLPLIGAFQAENAVCALGLALASGVSIANALAALENLKGAPGRLEYIGETAPGASVLVDYAHTPHALQAALEAVRPHVPGRIICVFGCGGDRDPGKRGPMGAAAAARADVVIVTDDNPRGEDPALIRAAALRGAEDRTAEVLEISDRRTAIREAVNMARTGDMALIAGKGHETGQIIGGVTHPFDDREEARKAAEEART